MSDLHERLSLFVLQRLFFCHPRIGLDLLRLTGDARALFEGDRAIWRDRFGANEQLWNAFRAFDGWRDAECALHRLTESGTRLIGIDDAAYPSLLKEIHDPPPALFVKGQGDAPWDSPVVAIVGSRKASAHGRSTAAAIAEELSHRGIAVASGMAYGIDAAAHRGALAGPTGTIAVWGSGIDLVYPPAHADLARRIEEAGLIVSEFPPGTLPLRQNFPQRNRIISGLALATLVVEAAEGSGSLITARFALEQGREVMACPGRAGDPIAQGTHRLLRDGACLVERGEDVLALLAAHPLVGKRLETAGHFGADGDKASALLRAIRELGTATVDALVAATGQGAAEVTAGLTVHVVDGTIVELPGQRFRIKAAKGR